MATDKDIIVAIELGSSAIRGIAGKKDVDGKLHILDIVERKSKNCIRKGTIYNLDKTAQALNSIFIQLREDLGVYINKAYVGISGQSLCTIPNSVSKQMPNKEVISEDIVDALKDANNNVSYLDKEILEVRELEYRIGNKDIMEPVGILSNHIEGRFLNIVARTTIQESIYKCFNMIGIQIIDTFISPLVLADNILTDNEKRAGCVLVDFGAETTTVSVYKTNYLRYLSVIPLGGNNVTLDICSKQVEEDEAEELKIKYGTAFSDLNKDIIRHIPLSIDPGITIAEDVLQEITEARMEEIIANVWAQIQQSNYNPCNLTAGIIITGGAANIKNIEKAISYKTKTEKIKMARTLHTAIDAGNFEETIQNMNANTLISLLSYGTCDCTDVDPQEEERIRQEEETNRKKLEEERHRKQVEEEQKKKEEEANKAGKQTAGSNDQTEDSEEETENKEKNGFMKSFKNKIVKLTKLFTETEE